MKPSTFPYPKAKGSHPKFGLLVSDWMRVTIAVDLDRVSFCLSIDHLVLYFLTNQISLHFFSRLRVATLVKGSKE